ncbi:MAG: hypothetical protein GH143_06535 [Calditrichaeota bacterium]|nr:hypothetical protein [Calditrichota bacterium]
MKIIYTGFSLISIAAAGLVFAVAMMIATGEPAYNLVMLVAAGVFGLGGPVLCWGIYRRLIPLKKRGGKVNWA